MTTSPDLHRVLLECGRNRQNSLLDLSGVTYMDSAGVATLVEGLALSRKNGTVFLVTGLSLNVRRAFRLNRLQSVLCLCPDPGRPESDREPAHHGAQFLGRR